MTFQLYLNLMTNNNYINLIINFIKNNIEHIPYIIILFILLYIYYYSKKENIIDYYHCLKVVNNVNFNSGFYWNLSGRTFKLKSKFSRTEEEQLSENYKCITKVYANKKYIFFSINHIYADTEYNKTEYRLFRRSIKNVFYHPIGKLPLNIIYNYYMLHNKKYGALSSEYLKINYPIIDSILNKILIENDLAIIISLSLFILGFIPILLKSIISIIINIII